MQFLCCVAYKSWKSPLGITHMDVVDDFTYKLLHHLVHYYPVYLL